MFKRLWKKEDGQVLVMVALLLGVLLAFAALVIDVGYFYAEKRQLQTAVDAAALAGAQELPDVTIAKSVAVDYAEKNKLNAPVVTPQYSGDPLKLKVVGTRTVPTFFARILGFANTDIKAIAVAQKVPKWSGEALPFLNLDDDYNVDLKIEAWEKTGPGDFESIWKDEIEMISLGKNDDHSQGYFSIDYEDGITITKGTVATIKQEVGYVFAQKKPVYIFSLSSEVIKSGKYDSGLKNKVVIPLSDLVLLQVSFDSYDESGKTLSLTVKEVYNINIGEYPTEHVNHKVPVLIE